MPRVDLDIYYKGFFKNFDSHFCEQFKKINGGHVISSSYYDVQFGRHSLIYRDKTHKLVMPVEHDTAHALVIYLHHFFENNKCDIAESALRKRIDSALSFLKVKHQFE